VGASLAAQPLAQRFVHEAYRHGKPIAVAPDGEALLEAAGIPPAAEGIVIGQGTRLVVNDLVKNIGQHRFPRRVSVLKPS
jgi:catalase